MAIFDGWNRVNNTVTKPAPKPEPAPPKPPTPTDNNDRYGIKPFTPTREGWAGGFFRNLLGDLATQFQQGYAPVIAGQAANLDPLARNNPINISPQFAKVIADNFSTYGQALTQANQPYSALPYIQQVLSDASKQHWPTTDPDSAYMDSAQYLADKSAALNTTAPVDNVDQTWFESLQDWAADAVNTITGNETTTESPAPTTPTTPEGFEQYDKGYVEQQPWYLNGDIGVFGKGVQPTEWTDPETGQTYRVEISPRGRGWYPVGWGDLPDMGTDTDTGGNDWWNYTGWGGGGGGGGYYSSPISYGNSNWIDRVLTNWRIRTR